MEHSIIACMGRMIISQVPLSPSEALAKAVVEAATCSEATLIVSICRKHSD